MNDCSQINRVCKSSVVAIRILIDVCRLSGLSPFYKDTARETLLAVQDGKWTFDSEAFADISNEARDFVSKLLEKDPKLVFSIEKIAF